MPSIERRTPKYRHYKPKDLGVVRINGRDRYLGEFDSPESWEKYHRLVAKWISGDQIAIASNNSGLVDDVTVNQVLLAYCKFARSYYVRDGESTSEVQNITYSLRPVRKLYGRTLAKEFGPRRLKTVREYMIDEEDLCRREINKRIGRIKRAFKYAVSEELVPPNLSHGLEAVTGLRRGRTGARESERVRPVTDEHVNAVLPFLPPQIVAMISLQRLTGMRPGEVVIIRPCDLVMDDDVWIYEVPRHKNDWREYDRFVAIGPRSQEILKPFLEKSEKSYLFSPRDVFEWRLENRQICYKKERATPVYPCELRARHRRKQQRRRRRSGRRIGERYTTETYWKALFYGFEKAREQGQDLMRWSPNQLRHNCATRLRKKYGLEGSRVSLGHLKCETTQIYAERDINLAVQIAREAG